MADNSNEQYALSQLNSGHFKEAIELYKTLLNETDSIEFKHQIAHCYWMRAHSFAQRGMYDQAVVLWENQHLYRETGFEGLDHYISWQIQLNDQSTVKTLLNQLTVEQIDQDYSDLAVLLGLLMITRYPEFEQNLAEDSRLIEHLKIVQSILHDFQKKDLNATNERLKKIPHRSAFRDFRLLLVAVLRMSNSQVEAELGLSKISESSPYSMTSKLILAYGQEGSDLIKKLIKFNFSQSQKLGEVKGMNQPQLQLIEQLTSKDNLSDKEKFNLVVEFRSLGGGGRRLCQALLFSYPDGQKVFEKNFPIFDKFESYRVRALSSEQQNNGSDAETYWRECISILMAEDADNELKCGVILRHLAEQLEGEEKNNFLIESLEYDSEDRESYLQIVNYFKNGQSKDYWLWLDKAVLVFPEDIELLTLCVKEKVGKKSFTEAIALASKILTIDPLNLFAKHTMFSSHLESARQFIKNEQFDLADSEIQQAEKLKLGQKYSNQAQLMQEISKVINQGEGDIQLLNDALNQIYSDPINARLHASMEGMLVGLNETVLMDNLAPNKDYLLSEQALNNLLQQLMEYESDRVNNQLLYKAVEVIKPELKRSLQQKSYSEDKKLQLCQVLDSINAFDLLQDCAEKARSESLKHKPLWTYYQVNAEIEANPARCSQQHVASLEQMREQAEQEKDHHTLVLISGILDGYYLAHPHNKKGFFDDLLGLGKEEVESDDPYEQLFSHVSDEVFDALNDEVEELNVTTSPELLVEGITKDEADGNIVLLAMMKEPDLFSALIMVKAAQCLDVEINVSYVNVLDKYGVKSRKIS